MPRVWTTLMIPLPQKNPLPVIPGSSCTSPARLCCHKDATSRELAPLGGCNIPPGELQQEHSHGLHKPGTSCLKITPDSCLLSLVPWEGAGARPSPGSCGFVQPGRCRREQLWVPQLWAHSFYPLSIPIACPSFSMGKEQLLRETHGKEGTQIKLCPGWGSGKRFILTKEPALRAVTLISRR